MDEKDAEIADHRERAFARLVSIRENLSALDPHFPMEMNYVEDFHVALNHLQDAGDNVQEFYIRDSKLMPSQSNPDPRSQLSQQSKRPSLPKIRNHVLRTEIDSVLGYFRLKAAIEADAAQTGETLCRLIGFETPARD